jgi:hypothetical protein
LSEKKEIVGDHPLNIVIDTKAFEQAGVMKAEEQPVLLPKMKGVPLSLVLHLLLSQVKGEKYSGAYIVRDGHIEVTTTIEVMREVLGPEGAKFEERGPLEEAFKHEVFHVVHLDIQKQPLQDALKQLAADEKVNIVLDPRVGDKAKAEVSATLENVLLGTALRLLADMADLKMVMVNNVYYVTTKANAEALEAEQARRRPKEPVVEKPQTK